MHAPVLGLNIVDRRGLLCPLGGIGMANIFDRASRGSALSAVAASPANLLYAASALKPMECKPAAEMTMELSASTFRHLKGKSLK
ncbi:MAG TPA: hypothetical protein VFA87_05485 [Rhizomicrobium sp.]|nr:hypothetical protein [Rhizomicrobium sp.]